jgi:hypothetical protein
MDAVGTITFENAAVDAGFAEAPRRIPASISLVFDNVLAF